MLREVDAGGFWVGYCAYDLGRAIERVAARTDDDLMLPDVAFARYDSRLVIHDDGELELIGDQRARQLVEAAVRADAGGDAPLRADARALDLESRSGRPCRGLRPCSSCCVPASATR